MMSNGKQLLTAVGCFLAVVLFGSALLVWPVKRETRSIRASTAELRAEVENVSGTAARVEHLQTELEEARRRVADEFKTVPSSPAHIVNVMPSLSLNVDGRVVHDSAISQGMPQRAISDSESTAMVVPLNAELKAQFDAVFSVLQTAERLDELIRISSVRMSSAGSSRQGQPMTSASLDDSPLVTAAIVFEAIYDPTIAKEQP